MRKSKILVVALIGILMVAGLVLAGCGDNCGGGCKVTWTSSGEKLGGGACGAYTCSSGCIVYRNWSSNKDLPGVNIIYRCDCE
jgi:Flp pilus assembly pilin Flp